MSGIIGLDANAVKAMQEFDPAALRSIGNDSVAIPCVAAEEVVSGWHLLIDRYKRQQDELRLGQAYTRFCEFHEFTHGIPLLRYTPEAQATYVSLRKGRGNRGRDDFRIAAICIAHDVPLLTRNVRDFDDLPGLKLRTW
jgi:tRNA(fMet)-specific endonuclease VapC